MAYRVHLETGYTHRWVKWWLQDHENDFTWLEAAEGISENSILVQLMYKLHICRN